MLIPFIQFSFNYCDYNEIGSGNGMGGLLIDKLYSPREVIISDMESHMSHINHNIELNSGESNDLKLWIVDGFLRNLSKSLKRESEYT
jgi:tRNA1(Val) A37 N6-methylase TrmN6